MSISKVDTLLKARSWQVSRADAMIYGAPRSGTTVLMSLMSTPRKTWCIGEPWNEEAGVVRNAPQRHAKAYDLDLSTCTSLEQVADAVESRGLYRWGAKEVFYDDFVRTAAIFDPRTVIFLVRDPRAACLSYKNCLREHPWNHKGINAPERTGDDEYLVQVFAEHCEGVLKALKEWQAKSVLIRYEDFLGEMVRKDLADLLTWPFTGDPACMGKRSEVREGVFPRDSVPDERLFELVEAEMGEYMRRFGYANSRVCV